MFYSYQDLKYQKKTAKIVFCVMFPPSNYYMLYYLTINNDTNIFTLVNFWNFFVTTKNHNIIPSFYKIRYINKNIMKDKIVVIWKKKIMIEKNYKWDFL